MNRTSRAMFRITIALATLGSMVWLFTVSTAGAQQSSNDQPRWKRDPSRWEQSRRPNGRSIQRFEKEQAENPPPKEGVLFAGSASISLWDTEKWFPEYATINRGFGGSMISDSTYFADRITIPHKPAVIVMYAGENDVTGGKPNEITARHFREFAEKIWKGLPKTRIVYVSVRPSNRNWQHDGNFRAVNALIRPITEGDERLYFVDVHSPMIGADGKPRRELYQEDDWHPSEAGYELWTGLTKPIVKQAMAAYRAAKEN